MFSAIEIVFSLTRLFVAVVDRNIIFFRIEVCEKVNNVRVEECGLLSVTFTSSLHQLLKFRSAVATSVGSHGDVRDRSKDDAELF